MAAKPLRLAPKRAARPEGGGRRAARLAGRLALAALRPVAARPVAAASIAAFVAFFGCLSANALLAQSGRHPHPILATRGAGEGSVAAVSDGGPVPLVTEVQTALAEAGYFEADVDGRPGPVTAAAIRAFQADNGLAADGEATPRLLAVLRQATGGGDMGTDAARVASIAPDGLTATDAADAPFPDPAPAAVAAEPAPPRDLVRRIQEGLTHAKVADLAADGIMGNRTEAAIRTFEAAHGLAVTGKPSEAMLARLKAAGGGGRAH